MDHIRLVGTQGFKILMEHSLISNNSNLDAKLQKGSIHSSELFKDKKQVIIQHGKELYRLMITRQGKLILNK